MAIRLYRSGSNLYRCAATLAATTGFWLSNANYTCAQPVLPQQPLVNSAAAAQDALAIDDLSFSQLPNLQSGTDDHQINSAQRLLTEDQPASPATDNRLQAKVIVGSNAAQALPPQRPAVVQSSKGLLPSFSPSVTTGMHQLRALSITQFETRLLEIWGDQLSATASKNGRFIRVALPTKSDKKMLMLVDRKHGKIQFEGSPELTKHWHKLLQKIDVLPQTETETGLVSRLVYSDIDDLPFVRPVGFQQTTQQPVEAAAPQSANQNPPANQRQLVQGIDGLKGQVFITQNPETGELAITGDPEDVAIVTREIARLSAQARASQPQPGLVPLENVRSNLIVTNIQEIYDARYAGINGAASITTVDNPNALVVVGSPEAIEAVRALAKTLDVKPDSEAARDFKTFGLKHIAAVDATNRLRRYFGQTTGADGELRIPGSAVEIIPDFRSNQITVKGSPNIIASAEAFIKSIDVAEVDGGAVNEVRIVQLRNSLAADVAFVIQNAINGQLPNAGQAFASSASGALGQQQGGLQSQTVNDPDGLQSQLRSAMLSLTTRDESGKLIKSGILFDVRITADSNSNSLVITGPAESIPLVVELAQQLDRLPNAESQIKVFELVYSDASAIFDMLNSLFGSQNAGTPQLGAAGGTTSLPLQSGSGTDGASLINLRFAVEPRSNAIIASGPAQDLQVIEDLLNRLDSRAVNNFPAKVYRLSNAPAQDVSDAINAYLDGRADLIENDPRTNTGVPAVNRAVIVTPEVVSNSLIVSALPEYRKEIEDIILSLDRRPPLVKVKVMIAEVNLGRLEEFGVELGIQDSLLFDRGTSVAAGGALTGIGFPFNTATVPNANAFARESLAGQALSNLNVGRINSSLGFGGLVLSAGNESVNVLVRALQNSECARVLSKPQIMTLENLEGIVSVGANVARIAGSTQTNFGLTQDIEFQDVGVILRVTPRVSPDGLIVLSVNAENSSLGPEATGTAVGVGATGEIIRAQQILKTEAITTLSARSGQTVVFSGLITESKTHVERGAPILSDLPIIGPLFKFESDEAARTELLIFMTPYLITDDNDIAILNQDETERMHWCLSDVADVYGNTDFGGSVNVGAAVETVYPDADPTGQLKPVIYQSKNQAPAEQTAVVTANDSPEQPQFDSVSAVQQPKTDTPAPSRSAKKNRWNFLKPTSKR